MAWWDEIQLDYTRVEGRFVSVAADSGDEDLFPDVSILKGYIQFTPTVTAGRVGDVLAALETIRAEVIEGEIVTGNETDGYTTGIRIPATDADLGVTDWAWKATFHIDGLDLLPLVFKAPAGETVALTGSLIPVKSVPYQIVDNRIVGVERGEGTLIRWLMSDGTATNWIDLPNGPTGLTPDITIGTVVEADTAAATMTGPKESRVLNLALPRATDGVTPVFSIGTVTSGEVASATLSGDQLTPALNLVLPKGEKGDSGGVPDNSVTTPKIADGAVTNPKIVSVDAAKLTGNLAAARIPDRTVPFNKLQLPALGTANLNDMTTPGQFQQGASGEATLARNYPGANLNGVLIVYAPIPEVQIVQEYVPHGQDFIARRSKFGSWASWGIYRPETDTGWTRTGITLTSAAKNLQAPTGAGSNWGMRRIGKMVQVSLMVELVSATASGSALNGNIGDTVLVNVPEGFRPAGAIHPTATWPGNAMYGGRMWNNGDVALASVIPGQAVAANTPIQFDAFYFAA